MQTPSPFDNDHHGDDDLPTPHVRRAFGRATNRLIRFALYALSFLGGAATGTSATALVLYQPTDWRWAWLGVGGLVAGACAVGLIRYFPRDEGTER